MHAVRLGARTWAGNEEDRAGLEGTPLLGNDKAHKGGLRRLGRQKVNQAEG